MNTVIEAPRLNANEDQILIVQILVEDGQAVAHGEALFVAETTKAASEVLAPVAGRVARLAVRPGTMVDVGSVLCCVEDGSADERVVSASDQEPAPVKITLKARQRAGELGISLDDVAAQDGRIGIEQVERHARQGGNASLTKSLDSGFTSGPSRSSADCVVVGAGGHAACIIDLLHGTGHRIVGCTGDASAAGREVAGGVRVLEAETSLQSLFDSGVRLAFVGVGGAVDNGPRQRLFEELVAIGFHLPPLISPRATIGIDVELGAGTVVFPQAVIGPRTRIGANCIINAGAVICHDSIIGDHCHLTPGALVAGECRIGAGSTIGMASTLLNRSVVGAGCLVHNGAAVAGGIPDDTEITARGLRTQRPKP